MALTTTQLVDLINSYVKENGTQEITGIILNDILKKIVYWAENRGIEVTVTDLLGNELATQIVSISSNVIEIDTGISGMKSISAPLLKTGQTVSASLYDDAYYQHGRESNMFILPPAPAGFNWYFGHQFRFTGLTGGYYDYTTSQYRDSAGNVTTLAGAFPNGHVLDWSQYDWDNEIVMHYSNIQTDSFSSLSVAAETLTLAGFFGWRYPNWNEAFALWYWGIQTISNSYISYPPFSLVSYHNIITNTRNSIGSLMVVDTSNLVGTTTDSAVGTTLLVRQTNISEL